MPLTWNSQLAQDTADSITWSIGFNSDITFWIKVSKDQSFSKYLSQMVKDFFSVGGQEAVLPYRVRIFGQKFEFGISSFFVTNLIASYTQLAYSSLIIFEHWGKWSYNPAEVLDEILGEVSKSYKNLDVLYWSGFKLVLNSFDSFVFYLHSLNQYDVA